MTMTNLKDVYHDQLQDLWSANTQAIKVVAKLGEAAGNKDLSEALIAGVNGMNDGIAKIEEICNAHDIAPSGEHCKGMEGLVSEAQAHALDANFEDPAVRDAMIITQYQRMVHYALAGYGCLVAFANRLGHDSDGALLQECLDSTYDGDRTMTSIATGGINKAAA